jgi:hypothetical protein
MKNAESVAAKDGLPLTALRIRAAAPHSEFTGTLFIFSKILEWVGAAMMIVPVRRKP